MPPPIKPGRPRKKIERLNESLASVELSAEQTKISEFISVFEKLMPPDEIAKYMARMIRSGRTKNRERMVILNFYMTAKRFIEKNTPALSDDDFSSMSDEQLTAYLHKYMPSLEALKSERDAHAAGSGKNHGVAVP